MVLHAFGKIRERFANAAFAKTLNHNLEPIRKIIARLPVPSSAQNFEREAATEDDG